MLTKKEIAREYKGAKQERDRWEAIADLYRDLYSVRQTMEMVAEKYGELFWCVCPERRKKEVPLTFCIEKCTIKCGEWLTVRKHRPKLLAYVEKLNGRFFRILCRIKELRLEN